MNLIVDEKNRTLASVALNDGHVEIHRFPCCSIGEYFAILSFLMDEGYIVE